MDPCLDGLSLEEKWPEGRRFSDAVRAFKETVHAIHLQENVKDTIGRRVEAVKGGKLAGFMGS
ncbi:hypothetical protein Leryth_022509 [Lithospermum erythrorhizon]|nr:hypothetical protein Leryth_022509 [Lithospermum erythrorhizon]